MANIGSFSRHKHLQELLDPIWTANGDGAVVNVYSPAERQAKVLANITNDISAATQLAFLDAATDTITDAGQLTILGNLQTAAALPTGAAITTGATTVLAAHHRTSPISGLIKLTLTAFALTGSMADNTAAAVGASLITFPTETFVAAKYLTGSLIGTGADDRTTAMEVGLGTTIGSGANATLSAGGATFESILGGTPTSAFTDTGATSTATVFAPRETSVNASIAPGIILRTTTPGLAVFLNAAGAAQDLVSNGSLTFTFTGTVVVEYIYPA